MGMVSANDAFDVITDPVLASKTTFLKRKFALKLAAQATYDAFYAHEDPDDLVTLIKSGAFDPSDMMLTRLLELSGSIDAKTLDVLRDVGVGAPQMGIAGIGVPAQQTQNDDAPKPAPRRNSMFRR